MSDTSHTGKPLLVTSVIASLTAGGIGPVCRYVAEGMAKLKNWQVTLLSLHDSVGEFTDEARDLRIVCLGLDGNCARLFLQWLAANPQDLIITSDVSRIEPAFRFLPPSTHHVVQIHDSGRRYRDVAVRHAAWIDGVTCVGRHIEAPLRRSLEEVGFHGLLRAIHNGASFPPVPNRHPHNGPLRLLFVGRVEALKGVFDFVPLLQWLKRQGVPVTLNLVGGENETLRRQFQRKGLGDVVTWTGRVPHERCYAIAAESDIFLMASRKEPFGMVTIEAMSMGCVPVAYNIPSGSTEIIEHGKSGLLVPLGDIRSWADHIRGLHYDRKRLAELSGAAIARARGTFNAEAMARNMAAFLTDILAHAETHPAKREAGSPPEVPAHFVPAAKGYQRIHPRIREALRNFVGARPRLCFWWLNR
jgi:glycosyltransferase involved in cell wall biosynthesis